MARANSHDVIVLGKRRRKRLERIVARASSPQHLVLRAKIVLAAWRREPNAKIARNLGICVDTVRTWRHRFRREGMPGLVDRPCSGRPPVYGSEDQLLIVATVTGQNPEVDSHWTHQALADHLHELLGISVSPIVRILASLDLTPHRVRGWLNRPAGPVRPGQAERREFEHVRHGTVSLMAAVNVTTGTVHPKIIARNDSDTFIEFLTELAHTVEATKKIHLILDNGFSRTSKQTRK